MKAHYVGVDVVSINIETSAVSALVDGTLIVHSTNGGRNQGGLHAVDPETAQVIWEVFGGPGAPGFTTVRDTIWRVDGELLYGFGPDGTALGNVALPCAPTTELVVSSDGNAMAVRCTDDMKLINGAGELQWERTGSWPLALSGSDVLLLEGLELVSASLADGTPTWSFSNDTDLAGAVSTGALVAVLERNGTLSLLDAKDGTLKLTLEGVADLPVFAGDGRFAVPDADITGDLDHRIYSEQGELLWRTGTRCDGPSFDSRGRMLAMCVFDGWTQMTLWDVDGEVRGSEMYQTFDPNNPIHFSAPLVLDGRAVILQNYLGELSIYDVRGAEPALGTWSRGDYGNRYSTFGTEH